jgi:glycosyltransferase involved in cell wall biosynthesis
MTGSALSGHRITVCVCTYKRPELLRELLKALSEQVTSPLTFDVVVVDNDVNRSSQQIVQKFAAPSSLTVAYDCEPERNIASTRNRAVKHATGDFIAFVDDDECPPPDWLRLLFDTLRTSGADAVLGPVVPSFPVGAPTWLTKGQFFYRQRFPTGTVIQAEHARTGNVLMRRSMFVDGELWFDPALGRSGGEDSDFFARQCRKGRVLVWCDEAEVPEVVPPERWTIAFHLRRLWRSGTITGEWTRSGRRPFRVFLKNLVALILYTVALPLTVVLPKHRRVRMIQKLAYAGGAVTAHLGFPVLKYRE